MDETSIRRLVQAQAVAPPQFVQPVPRLAPPYNAKTWSRYAIFVVAPNTATGDAGAILGATALALAESAARFSTVSVLAPTSVTDNVAVFSETMPDSLALHVAKFGARVHSTQRAIRFHVRNRGSQINDSQGSTGANSGTFELNSWGDLDEPCDVYADVGPRETFSIDVRNLDLNGGYLVEARAWGWTYDPRHAGPGDGQRNQLDRQLGPDGYAR